MKWYTQILSSVATFFGLSQESTEAEVHEHLAEFEGKTLDEVVELRLQERTSELEQRANLLEQERDAALAQAQDLENNMNSTQSELNKQIEALNTRLEEKDQEVDALQAKIAQLEESAAGEHTGGRREKQENTNTQPWLNSPVNRRAIRAYDGMKK